MLSDFNLLITTPRRNEREASDELRHLLTELGDLSPEVEKTYISGLVVAKTILNAFETVRRLRQILAERPYEFRFTLRMIPIEKVIQTDLVEIELAATELASGIGEDETFRVTVEKRFSATPTQSIIEAAASNIRQKVNLKNPDKILLIEVIGGLTGMSLVRPDNILSVVKEKML